MNIERSRWGAFARYLMLLPALIVGVSLALPAAASARTAVPFQARVHTSALHASAPLALTGSSGHIYWTNEFAGTVSVANLDGTSPHTIVTGQNMPYGVAVDSSHIQWANYCYRPLCAFEPFSGTVNEANLDGSDPRTIETGQYYPTGVAVDSSHIYWSNSADGTEHQANLNGSNPQAIATSPAAPYGDTVQGNGVAVHGAHIYWTNFWAGTVYEANLDGTNARTIETGQRNPNGVALTSSRIYWANDGDGGIHMANLDGSNPRTIETGQSNPNDVAVTSSHIYWTNGGDGTIHEANLDGSNPRTIETGQNGPQGIAVSAPSQITGAVRASATHTPLAGICARAYNSSGAVAASTQTNSSGSYAINALPTGSYRVAFIDCSHRGYIKQYYKDKPSLTSADPIAVAANTVSGINAAMVNEGQITGTVIDQGTGAPLAGICAKALDSYGNSISVASTNANGAYLITGLKPGAYRVKFTSKCGSTTGYQTQYYKNKTTLASANPVTVTYHGTAPGVNAAMSR